MRKVLLDTSVYGKLLIDPRAKPLRQMFRSSCIIYGATIIRRELRSTPKNIRYGAQKVRLALLAMYDDMTKERIRAETPESQRLAQLYVRAYREFGGNVSSAEVLNDFRIIALATVHGMDVVVSDDERTMLSEAARKAYFLINAAAGEKNCRLIPYRKLTERSTL